MGETAKESAGLFFTEKLPLYHGPLVKIRLQPSCCEYTISKGLLCAQSPVFTAMFEGGFREAQEQTVDIQEMTGVISKDSLEALIQWLYLGSPDFDWDSPGGRIEAAIEFARLADKYEITRIESQTAQYIKETIIANQLPGNDKGGVPINSNTHLLEEEDIVSALMLRDGHPVRHILAAACVRGYLQKENHDFASTARAYPKFAGDLLHEVRLALNSVKNSVKIAPTFTDPIDGKEWYLGNFWIRL